ncbi:MAG: hypothetical protein AAGG65_14970 [Pseudomonadota bacterium]
MTPPGNLSVSLVQSDADKARLARFLFDRLVIDCGVHRDDADYDRRTLEGIHLSGRCYAASHGDEIVGSMRINDFTIMVPTFCLTAFEVLAYPKDVLRHGALVTNAVVDQDWRRSPAFVSMAIRLVRDAIDRGIRIFFLATAIGRRLGVEQAYVSMYRAMGFQPWRPSAPVPGVGEGSVLVLDIDKELSRSGSLTAAYFGAHKGPSG